MYIWAILLLIFIAVMMLMTIGTNVGSKHKCGCDPNHNTLQEHKDAMRDE